jgi:hypothetical protein
MWKFVASVLLIAVHSHFAIAQGPVPLSCAIPGQVYLQCGTACPPTCADPDPSPCTRQCVAGCQCPQGTVLDEIAQQCVSVEDCSKCSSSCFCSMVTTVLESLKVMLFSFSACQPDCTHDFCSQNPEALCNV